MMHYIDYVNFLCGYHTRPSQTAQSLAKVIYGLPAEDFWSRLEPIRKSDQESEILRIIADTRKHLEFKGIIGVIYMNEGDFGEFKHGDTFGTVLDKLSDMVKRYFSRRAET